MLIIVLFVEQKEGINMKIGILTFHKAINYGAYMQSYALSTKLQEVFPEHCIEIIDYVAPKERRKIYINILWTFKHYGLRGGYKELKKIQSFNNSYKELKLSSKNSFTSLQDLYKYIENNYQLLIIGSDAVFNWNQNGFPSAFIPVYNFTIPVVTYAASVHGLEYYDVEKEKIRDCKFAFSNLSFIGVRDENTERFVKFCDETLKPIHCCDPTVIMDYDALYSIKHRELDEISKAYNIDLSKQYIVMMLENQEIAKEVYERYSKEYTIISLFKKNKYSDMFLYDLTPVEWALVLKYAKLVVTNFFHGTLVSLGQGTATIVVDLSNYDKPYEGKLDDLVCHRLGLPELYVKGADWNTKKCEMFNTMNLCLNEEFNSRINNSMKVESEEFDKFYKYMSTFVLNNKGKTWE